MLDLTQIKKALEHANLKAVAQAAGVSYPTLAKVIREDGENTSYMTVKKLSDYLEGRWAQ